MTLPPILRSDETSTIMLPSGASVALPICHPTFRKWKKPNPGFTYGGKPFLDYDDQAVFAELAILRIFLKEGWDGVWVETYGGTNFLREMPTKWKLSELSVVIPDDKRALLNRISNIAKTTACFDVFVWKDEKILFCEAKHQGKDKLTKPQYKFIEAALALGIPAESFLIVEWRF